MNQAMVDRSRVLGWCACFVAVALATLTASVAYGAPADSPGSATVDDQEVDQPLRHDGFYLRLSSGGGFLGVGNDEADTTSKDVFGPAFTLSLEFGPTVAPGVASGIGLKLVRVLDASADPGGQSMSATLAFGGAFIDWFPDPTGGFHVGGRLGPAVSAQGDSEVHAGGGVGAFMGWDQYVTDYWSLGASLQGGAAFGIGEDETLISRTVSLELSLLRH